MSCIVVLVLHCAAVVSDGEPASVPYATADPKREQNHLRHPTMERHTTHHDHSSEALHGVDTFLVVCSHRSRNRIVFKHRW